MQNLDLAISLPRETWRLIHAMIVEQPVPRYAAIPAIAAFEAAHQAAQQPPATDDKKEPA